MAHFGVNGDLTRSTLFLFHFWKYWLSKNYKFKKWIIPVIKEKIGLKKICGWTSPYLHHVIHLWSSEHAQKGYKHRTWYGNLAIIADKHPVGIMLHVNSTCCIDFQNLTLDFIFFRACSSYLLTNNMLSHSIFIDHVSRLPQNVTWYKQNSLNTNPDSYKICISKWFLDVCNA
jgi:hypothetical protein